MSRGLGKWQRGILAALQEYPAVYLSDLLDSDRTKAEYNALHRAAWTLATAERVQLVRYMAGATTDSLTLVVARLGYVVVREQVPRISVDCVLKGEPVNT